MRQKRSTSIDILVRERVKGRVVVDRRLRARTTARVREHITHTSMGGQQHGVPPPHARPLCKRQHEQQLRARRGATTMRIRRRGGGMAEKSGLRHYVYLDLGYHG